VLHAAVELKPCASGETCGGRSRTLSFLPLRNLLFGAEIDLAQQVS
jgi:hypothetical protein